MRNSSISKGGPCGLNSACKRLRVPFLVDLPEEAALRQESKPQNFGWSCGCPPGPKVQVDYFRVSCEKIC
jgi:hypothetical protein